MIFANQSYSKAHRAGHAVRAFTSTRGPRRCHFLRGRAFSNASDALLRAVFQFIDGLDKLTFVQHVNGICDQFVGLHMRYTKPT